MKKFFCAFVVLIMIVGCLSACDFTQNIVGDMADGRESTLKAEELLLALSENRPADAKELMHQEVAEKSETALAQISTYLAGRTVSDMEALNVNIKTTTGTGGKITQEQIAFKLTLSDNSTVYLNALYYSDSADTGFASFQLVIGVI